MNRYPLPGVDAVVDGPARAGIRPRPEGQETPTPITGDGHDTQVPGGVK